jgi:hypothetical protein
MTSDQERLLNPSSIDTVAGFILSQAKGTAARKRLVRWHLNMIDCMKNLFCGVMNNKKRFQQVKDYHDLASSIAAVEEEKALMRQERDD